MLSQAMKGGKGPRKAWKYGQSGGPESVDRPLQQLRQRNSQVMRGIGQGIRHDAMQGKGPRLSDMMRQFAAGHRQLRQPVGTNPPKQPGNARRMG